TAAGRQRAVFILAGRSPGWKTGDSATTYPDFAGKWAGYIGPSGNFRGLPTKPRKENGSMSGTLYIVGTPIGNLGDLSPRAVEILQSVDFIAAEDTRVTLKLLNHFGIKKPMVSYFEHNKYERGEIICQRLRQGEDAALVSD